MKDVASKPKKVLSDEEKKRLVAYFNVLIEMDFELKKLQERESLTIITGGVAERRGSSICG